MNYRYFLVTGGTVKAAHERWEARRMKDIEVRNALREEFGASGVYANSNEVRGLDFDGAPPAGWRKIEAGVYCPYARTPEGKAILKRFRESGMADAQAFQDEVIGPGSGMTFMEGLSFYYMCFESIGDSFILKVPDTSGVHGGQIGKSDWESPDEFCREIKTSEYWVLKETEKAKMAKTE